MFFSATSVAIDGGSGVAARRMRNSSEISDGSRRF
jgi:hypothetical protein